MKTTQSQHRAGGAAPLQRPGMGRGAACLAGLLAALSLAGCQSVHEVTVDAISNSQKQAGQAYRLEVLDPSGGVDAELQALAVTTIKQTLAARGMYEAPPGAKIDMIINFEYGVGHGHIKIVTQQNNDVLLGPYVTPQTSSKAVVVFDKFIELTAREAVTTPDPAHPGAPARPGEELWNIRASIEDPKKDLSTFLPALASACIDYIGENSGQELHFKVDAATAKVLMQRHPPAPPSSPPPAGAK